MSILLEASMVYDSVSVDTNNRGNEPAPPPAADAALVGRAQAGDFHAFEEIVRRYRNDVFGVSYRFVRNREEAWDLSQEVFVKAHRAIGRFRGDASIRTWLIRIAVNQCKDYLKRRRLPTVPLEDMAPGFQVASNDPAPAKALEAREIGQAIEQALDTLPPKHRTAFVLREYEGLSYEEMAEVMECNVGTVMSRLHHARRKLRKALLRMGIGEDWNL